MSWPGSFLLFLTACSVKATALFGVGRLVAVVARGQSAAFRHRIWLVAILASLALPFLMAVLPAWQSDPISVVTGRLWSSSHFALAPQTSSDLPGMIIDAVIRAPAQGAWPAILLFVWPLGFFVLALRMIVGLARLAGLSARARPLLSPEWLASAADMATKLRVRSSVRLLETDEPKTMPLTWGALRPMILLPSTAMQWPEERRRVVLTHEMAHVARFDWLFQMCAQLAQAIYWFHPLTWLAANRLRQEGECACDDAVLRTGIAAPDYAQQLLQLAGTLSDPVRAWSSALAFARGSHLERRFTAMLNPSVDRGTLSRRGRILTLVSSVVLLLLLAALRLPAQNVAGIFSGTIVDPSGAVVPNSTVIMTDSKTHKTVMTTTDAQGKFSFASLPAGRYDLRAMKRGFDDFKAEVMLTAGQDKTQNITLNVAAVTYQEDVVAKGTTKAVPPSETGGKTTRVRVGGDIQAPKLINKVQPVYPENARAAGSQGTVILHAIIGLDGAPLSLRVVNDKIDPELARAAIESVSKWRYSPTLLNGQPIEVDTTIEVNFSLQP